MVSYCSRSRVGYSRSKLYGLNTNMTVALTMPTSGNVTLIGTGGAFFGNMFLSPTFSLSLSLLSPGAPTALPSTSLQQTATPSFRTGIESMYQFCFCEMEIKTGKIHLELHFSFSQSISRNFAAQCFAINYFSNSYGNNHETIDIKLSYCPTTICSAYEKSFVLLQEN